MRYTKVDKVPVFKKRKNDLKSFLESFLLKGIPWAEVFYTPGEYKTTRSAYNSLRRSAKRSKFPVSVRTRNEKIYLINETLQETKEKGGFSL